MSPKHVLILGGGTAGWMAANLMAKRWASHRVKVTLVSSPEIGIIGVGEGSTPSLKRFFELVDVAESEWMPRCEATYKVNIRFAGWSPRSGIDNYSHPFISQVDTFTQRPFIVNCLTRRLGLAVHTQPDDFLLNGVLARQGKTPVAPANFPFRMEYGYHFNAGLLGDFLRELAVSRGVTHAEHKIIDVTRDAHGAIASLRTDTGDTLEADFFIDCTGFVSLLMQKTLGVPFDRFKANLFNDRAVVMPTQMTQVPPVETLSTALSAGWCWTIPLTSRFGNGYVYSSDFISQDQAEHELRCYLGRLDDPEPCRHLRMRVGQLREHWSHNCLGLGLSQGFIEPLEATALHLVQVTVELFMQDWEKTWESSDVVVTHRNEFNQKIYDRFERVRDYIVAHYRLNTRDDSDYWRANRHHQQLSESLQQLLEVWYRRGDLSQEIERQQLDSHFGSLSWHCLLAGYGAFPTLAPRQPGKGDRYIEERVQHFLDGCALNFSNPL